MVALPIWLGRGLGAHGSPSPLCRQHILRISTATETCDLGSSSQEIVLLKDIKSIVPRQHGNCVFIEAIGFIHGLSAPTIASISHALFLLA